MDTTISRSAFQANWQKIISVFAVLTFIILTTVAVARFLPHGVDWDKAWYDASLKVLQGQSPYNGFFFAPPWTLALFVPMSLLPQAIGRGLLFSLSVLGFSYTAYRMGAKPITMGAFLISPPVVHSLLNANIDFLPLLGFVMPAQIGLFFVLIKPQIGIGVAAFWLVEAWRRGRIGEVIRTFAPVTAAYLLSLALYGLWPLKFADASSYSAGWNASLWPLSLPAGLALLVYAIRKSDIRASMPAGACLSPYVLLHAWSGALIALVGSKREFIAAIIGLWGIVIMQLIN